MFDFYYFPALSDLEMTGTISNSLFGNGCQRFGLEHSNTVCAAPGEAVTITCMSSSTVSLHLPNDTVLTTGMYTIPSVTKQDTGYYTCQTSSPCNDDTIIELILPSE